MSFETSIFFVKVAEDDSDVVIPTDRGGRTRFGISERWHPPEKYPEFWSDPSWERATLIYFREYWDPARCADLPEHYQVLHLDCAVHSGVSQAAKVLQRGLGVPADGIIGEVTLGRAWERFDRTDEILAERTQLLLDIVQRYPDQEANWIGWHRRSYRLVRYALGVQYGIPIHPNGEMSRYA